MTSFQVWNRPCKMARYSLARKRCLPAWKCWERAPNAERKRWACFADLNFRIFFSRSRVGWCEFSARMPEPLVLPMFYAWQDFTFRCSITLQFISNDDAGDLGWQAYLEASEKLSIVSAQNERASRRVCHPRGDVVSSFEQFAEKSFSGFRGSRRLGMRISSTLPS